MSFRNLILSLTFMAIFAMGLRFSVDTDTWWQLRTGELIVHERTIPQVDSFSYTRQGETWRYPSTAWLMELKLYLIYDWFGAGGLNVWMAGMITLAFAFVYMSMSGGGFLRAFVLILATVVSGVYWAARPYMATFVLSAVYLWILEDFRWKRKNRLVWLPVLMVIWVNSHPGFAIGVILLVIYLFDETVRWIADNAPLNRDKVVKGVRGRVGNLLLVMLAILIGACINPAGISIFAYPFETVSIGVLRDYIQEWQSPNFHELAAQPFIWLLVLTIAAVGASRSRIVLSDFILITVSVYLTLLAGRNMPLFALIAPIALTRYAVPVIEELRKKLKWKSKLSTKGPKWKQGLNLAIVAILAIVVVARILVVYPEAANRESYLEDAPVGAVEFIKRERPVGRLFNSYNWGGYLIWNLREFPVFVDGRTDLYSNELLTDWLQTVSGEDGWQDTLDGWDVDLVLIEPDWPLGKLLAVEGWHLIYEDQYALLYER